MRYLVPINDAQEDETQTVDIVTIEGATKTRLKKFRKYLAIRYKITQYEKQLDVIKALGFEDLVKAAKK
jgi:D-alanyl-D-alanine dipeptidase